MSGVFIGAKFDTISRMILRNYIYSLPVAAEPIDLDDLHLTIMYSKVDPKLDYPLIDTSFLAPVTPYKLVYIGNAIALLCESAFVRYRFTLAKACGMRSPYGSIIPHISLYYNPPMNLVLQEMPQPNFELFINKEYIEPLKVKDE